MFRDRSCEAVPLTVESGMLPMKLSIAPSERAVAVGERWYQQNIQFIEGLQRFRDEEIPQI